MQCSADIINRVWGKKEWTRLGREMSREERSRGEGLREETERQMEKGREKSKEKV